MSAEANVGPDDLLMNGELTVLGRIMPASNTTFLCRLGPEDAGVRAVYKPVAGERPLWDFADGTLAAREYAAWLVSEALGWDVVPPTVLREGSAGPGMVQLWCEPDPEQAPVDLLPDGPVPAGLLHVLDAFDQDERPVMLVHEDTVALRRMALFDVVVNNTDRKGGHVLAMRDGHRYGVDHGVCFHVDDKLRTVLWGFHGEPLDDADAADLAALAQLLATDLGERLSGLLTRNEIAATRRRLDRLLRACRFPEPSPGWPSIPWPAF
ncbi:SCO1664 family protein [Nocardioides pocheonensis]|uniref:SCO1664 family protein n=1 Tax=Nocardioides pocheonensis TaxID=661485 RepID=A0A3N0GQC4_9ACTN|nr:SCO1664 family protein [Nocardioides pocheonensis]RNM14310.1 SCO1664 family protein [Nocardioides pocheonensis]